MSELIPEQTADDTDADEATDDAARQDKRDEWLQSERPPHHSD